MPESEIDEADLHESIFECPDCGNLTIRGKWSMDGATTLTEAAEKLRDYAHELEHLRASGLELAEPIADDYGLIRPGGLPAPSGALEDGE
jgi:hypothetical protein